MLGYKKQGGSKAGPSAEAMLACECPQDVLATSNRDREYQLRRGGQRAEGRLVCRKEEYPTVEISRTPRRW